MLGSCSDDEFDKTSNVKEGVPVKLTLSMSASELKQVTTKAALSSDDFNAVYDIYVFIYNANTGKLEAKQGFSFTYAKTSGTITFSTNVTSGKKYIYAVANAGRNGLLNTLSTISTGSDLSELEKVTFTLAQKDLQRAAGSLMMSGSYYYSGQTETGYCEVPAPSTEGGGVTLTGGAIKLDHLDSQITFNIQSGSSSIQFIPEGWSVTNVPQTSNVIEQSEDVSNQNLFSIADAKFESSTITGGSFVFYMMENRKKAKATPTSVNEREAMESDGETYTYADDKAAYVQIKGTYKEYQNGKLQTYGNVVYTIHLGDFMTDFDNFKSERNNNYTYNITVNGVDDIIAEVTKSEAENDGADGNIYRSSNQYVMDAHYGTAVVTFNKSDGYNFLVGISTPYGTEQLYQYGKTDNLSDYDWVMFVRNNNASTTFAQYPGDSYTKDKGETTGKYSTDASPLMTIKQVIEELKDNADIWTNGKVVTYTAFVDEYYYEGNPWREFVNANDRTFSIYSTNRTSPDGKSSYSEPSFRITQRSIKTFYNTGLSTTELPTSWGVEAINEDASQLPFSGTYADSDLSSTKTNGRYNSWYQLTNKGKNDGKLNWSDFVSYATNKMTSTNNDVRWAFLTRNRDLDGDNIIDDDEIRWYTCATNQYVGMWNGQDALPTETHLFQGTVSTVTESNRYKYHLISSNNVRFWPEEGVSTGSEGMGSAYFFIRCARNLGGFYTGQPKAGEEPEGYVLTSSKSVKVGSNTYTYTTVDLSRMNSAALRSNTYSNISKHTEHSGGDLNKPYSSFTINYQNTAESKCPTGYRTPNQRELSLMAGFIPTIGGGVYSITYSDLTYKSNLYYSMATASGTGQYITISGTGTTTRCVKDGGY